MEKFKSYETAKAPVQAGERLPIGGYILKILKAEEMKFKNNDGRALKISFDIAEGEYKDFYKNNYSAQKDEDKKWKGNFVAYVPKEDGSEMDNWTASAFKGTTEAIEESNIGYHWDWNEATLKNKLVGGMFGNKEYEFNGRKGFYTDCRYLTSVESIKSGKLKVPNDKLLKIHSPGTTSFNVNDFEEIDTDDSDLPF